MRKPVEHVAADGARTYRVRFRQGGVQTSRTFRQSQDARTFAAILNSGPAGVTEALAWLQAREDQMAAAIFAEFFEHYVDQLTGVTIRTRADYRSIRRRYLSHLDTLPVPLINRAHVTTLVNTLEAEGKSPKTVRNVVHLLSSCLALAMDEGVIARNPCRRVRIGQAALGTRQQARFLTHAEFGALHDATDAHYRPLLAFLVGTGMRWSEATAIQARHIDLTAGTARVEQAWKKIPGGWELGPPKTEKALRTINPATGALLAAQPLLRKPRDFVFTQPSGTPVRHANFYNRVWQKACVRAGLGSYETGADGREHWDGPRLHDLRHTHASWLISDGQSLEAVQDQLGHESILTTRKVYGHLQPAIGVAVGKSASAALDLALANSPDGRPLVIEASADTDEGDDPGGIAADL